MEHPLRKIGIMIGLNNRVHTYARPEVKQALTEFFTNVFEADVMQVEGSPMLVFRFPDGSSYSVEFIEEALDEQQALRGAWLEVRTDDPEALKERISAAGLEKVEYVTDRFYFQAPGGQIWGVLSETSE